jgi:hypothetical protein
MAGGHEDRPPRTGYFTTGRRGAPALRGRRADKLRAFRQARMAADNYEQEPIEADTVEDEGEGHTAADDAPAIREQPRVFEDITAKAQTLSEPVKSARKVLMVSV